MSVPLGRGAVTAALALLLLVALASLARASHAAPTGVTVTPGASQLTVDWTASSGADGYRVQWKSGSQNWDPDTRQTTVSGGSTVTATISSLTPTTVYTVRVGATKGTEDPAWSATATGAPLFGCEGSTAVGGEQPVAGPNNDLIDDCENLLTARDSLRGAASLNWATTLAMASWDGLTVASNRVTEVDLSNKSLTGTIPAELGNLASLTSLKLTTNRLSGSIPAALGDLSNLTRLWLLSNRLSGPIPAGTDAQNNATGLAKLTNLQDLYLHDNQLSGEIPAALGELTSLSRLGLGGNRLSGPIPAGTDAQNNATGLAKLTGLTQLSLSQNQLSGPIPAALGNLTGLRRVWLYDNRLSGPIPAGTDAQNQPTGLAKLTLLQELHLNCNDLTGSVPGELGSITTLTKLGINGNPRLDPALPATLTARTDVTYPVLTCPAVLTGSAQAAAGPRLAAALSAAPDPVPVGGSVTYTLTVGNAGGKPLTGLFWRSPVLGVAQRALGDGTLAVGAAVAATFSFGPVTEAHLPGPIIVTVFADSDQTDDVAAALVVPVQAAPAAAGPQPVASDLDLVIVRAGFSRPDPPAPHLGHNILDLRLTPADGAGVDCFFLTHYETTGGLARWGYATSEILEERAGALTQYYQRGAVDCHFRDGRWRVERRLTWDFIGGGLGGAPDLGVEADLPSDQSGVFPGPWGHRVSNYAVDGVYTGFLDFFQAHGGVAAFGYPKTEARYDDHPAAGLGLPDATPGFIRQYFQAAVFEFHPDDPAAPVKLGLAGDLLRDLRYPNESWRRFRSFHPSPILTSGEGYVAERVAWGAPAG